MRRNTLRKTTDDEPTEAFPVSARSSAVMHIWEPEHLSQSSTSVQLQPDSIYHTEDVDHTPPLEPSAALDLNRTLTASSTRAPHVLLRLHRLPRLLPRRAELLPARPHLRPLRRPPSPSTPAPTPAPLPLRPAHVPSPAAALLTALRVALFPAWVLAAGGALVLFPRHLSPAVFAPGYLPRADGGGALARFAALKEHARDLAACFAYAVLLAPAYVPAGARPWAAAGVALVLVRAAWVWWGYEPARRVVAGRGGDGKGKERRAEGAGEGEGEGEGEECVHEWLGRDDMETLWLLANEGAHWRECSLECTCRRGEEDGVPLWDEEVEADDGDDGHDGDGVWDDSVELREERECELMLSEDA
ncbi:uncharacterized protein BXZ73DRAFT_96215 [Epithele typhae]|uniref:uncharacterized protein n=1 Tax=Epithele typhae TaxID=378194 RepID=UPI0020081D5B|nr:uncharacterized protein BXZ73DRAFT_96215 [Epithele typhae]KAH9945224.1 hypothetical protein BXZ73DRAFT_96215 [Epithele typhae]